MAFNSIWGGIARANSPFSVSMESFGLEDDIVNPNTGEVVGDVDTEIAEMATESAEISADVDNIQSASTAADIGETVAEAAQSVQDRGDASPEEAALIQAGAAQTLAGVGAPVSEISDTAQEVASESNGRYNIAAESFADKIKAAWQAIKEFVANLIRKAKEFINRLWNSTAGVLKKVKKLRERIKDLKDKPENDHIEKWYSFFKLITPTDTGVFDPKKAVDVYAEYTKDSGVDVMSALIAKFEADATKERIVAIAQNDEFKAQYAGTNDVSSYLGKGYKGTAENTPLGGYVLVTGIDTTDSISVVARIGSMTAKLMPVNKTFDPKKKEPKYATMSLSEIGGIADAVEKTIKHLEDWYNKGSKQAYDKIDSIRKKIDDLAKEAKDEGDSNIKDAMRVGQKLYIVPTQFVRVGIDACVHTIKVSNAMIALGNAMADQYKKKDK